MMKKHFILLTATLFISLQSIAQQPLYIVNGVEMESLDTIAPNDVEHTEMLPADDETIARYGEQGMHGVMLITLRYDTPAKFEAAPSFSDYIAQQVSWPEDEPAARIILRYSITPEGKAVVNKELESTDSRLKRRVLKALADAPVWTPAYKNNTPIESEGILHIQLPEGKQMPRQVELVYR